MNLIFHFVLKKMESKTYIVLLIDCTSNKLLCILLLKSKKNFKNIYFLAYKYMRHQMWYHFVLHYNCITQSVITNARISKCV